ncbi:hypothetical protein D3C71_1927960 [compost metagenome]
MAFTRPSATSIFVERLRVTIALVMISSVRVSDRLCSLAASAPPSAEPGAMKLNEELAFGFAACVVDAGISTVRVTVSLSSSTHAGLGFGPSGELRW